MIEVRNLTKRYGDTVAVDDLSFVVNPGHVTGFLGPNGAGKTTTMRMMVGLAAPTSGTATINGTAFGKHHQPLREVGALLEAKAFHDGRSAFNHLLCLAQGNQIPRKRVDEVLGIVGLSDVAGKRAGGFSLGMGQRLGIAAALLGDPGVMIFDEPVNGLDPDGILWVRNLLKSLATQGRTILVSSHLMSEMAQTAEHLVVIGKGKMIADVSVDEFIQLSSQNFVRVRSPQSKRLAELVKESGGQVAENGADVLNISGMECEKVGDLAAQNAITLHELSPQAASLEEAFMELTHDSVEFRTSVADVAGPTEDLQGAVS